MKRPKFRIRRNYKKKCWFFQIRLCRFFWTDGCSMSGGRFEFSGYPDVRSAVRENAHAWKSERK